MLFACFVLKLVRNVWFRGMQVWRMSILSSLILTIAPYKQNLTSQSPASEGYGKRKVAGQSDHYSVATMHTKKGHISLTMFLRKSCATEHVR